LKSISDVVVGYGASTARVKAHLPGEIRRNAEAGCTTMSEAGHSGEAGSMNGFNTLFGFTGRINRAKFWLGLLIGYLSAFAGIFIAAALDPGGAALLLFAIPGFWMIFAVHTKRLHDMDRSAWWLIAVCLIPGFFLALGLIPGTEGDNRFGPDPLPARPAAFA
jgi:uncharacterized membrane protein YhaH (DUF805 family)